MAPAQFTFIDIPVCCCPHTVSSWITFYQRNIGMDGFVWNNLTGEDFRVSAKKSYQICGRDSMFEDYKNRSSTFYCLRKVKNNPFILTGQWICFQEDQEERAAQGSGRDYLVDLCETQSLWHLQNNDTFSVYYFSTIILSIVVLSLCLHLPYPLILYFLNKL